MLNQGNSDPFNASTLHITPVASELLHLASDFYVFWAWHVTVSKGFLQNAKTDWLADIQKSLSHDTHLHAMLAAGAYVKERSFSSLNSAHVQQRAVLHKTHAISCLRRDLSKAEVSAANAVLITILRLLALEFYSGNYHAAALHHRVAREFIQKHKFPGWHDAATFSIADVWIATALLRRPLASSADWDPGPWSDQAASSSLILGPLLPSNVHHSIPLLLQATFQDIREVVAVKQQLKNVAECFKLPVVSWIDTRTAALKGRLLEISAETSSLRSRSVHNSRDVLLVSSSLAAIIFLNVIFILDGVKSWTDNHGYHCGQRMPSKVFGLALERLRKYLSHQLHQLDQGGSDVDWETTVFIAFICALAGEVRPVMDDPSVMRHTFLRVSSEHSLRDVCDARELLSRFLYDSDGMNSYLTNLLRLEGGNQVLVVGSDHPVT
jgi:hypothetical protein